MSKQHDRIERLEQQSGVSELDENPNNIYAIRCKDGVYRTFEYFVEHPDDPECPEWCKTEEAKEWVARRRSGTQVDG